MKRGNIMRPVVSVSEAERRLAILFPRTTFDSALSNRLAASAVTSLLYVDAVADKPEPFWARPSMVLWMNPNVLTCKSDAERVMWRSKAARGHNQLRELHTQWGIPQDGAYADNSREPLRDETLSEWQQLGAVKARPDTPVTSSKGRWALEPAFADLFAPNLRGQALEEAIAAWRNTHLTPAARLRTQRDAQRRAAPSAVTVNLPGGGTRLLEPGDASLIIKYVVEEWAPQRLTDPGVVMISEPGDKLHLGDDHLLRVLQLTIDISRLLPDIIIVDLHDDTFWFIEVVHTDGPVDEKRKQILLKWAAQHSITADKCRFLTAFHSRSDPASKRRLKDIAVDTFVYFANEPGMEMSWHSINP